jgi:tetratricopeptide (TPR) repeat protein
MARCAHLAAVFGIFVLCSCSFGVAGDVQSGRRALSINQDEQALAYFQRAADSDPNYIFTYDIFRESVWTYVGRVQYRMGRYDQARSSLERALSRDKDDLLAKLYLGLTLARRNNNSQGLPEIRTGLQQLYDWLDYMQYSRRFAAAFWDPLRQIRNEIKKDLDMISGKDIDWPKLFDSAEWVGREMEEEIDRVQGDEQRQFDRRDFPRHSGGGVGVGIGF